MSEILKAEKISFYYGKKQIIKDVTFNIEKGEFISFVGKNGSGKTTLFNILLGELKPYNGIVTYTGKNVHNMKILERAKNFAAIHQNEDLKFPFTVFEIVAMGIYPNKQRFKAINKLQLEKIQWAMNVTDTEKFAQKNINCLSGGEKQRVILARALVQNPKILFMDEAMADFDINARIKMTKLLKELIKKYSLSVISVNHDIENAYKYSDKVMALKDGALIAEGSPIDIMDKKFFADVFDVKAEIFKNKGFFIEDNLN